MCSQCGMQGASYTELPDVVVHVRPTFQSNSRKRPGYGTSVSEEIACSQGRMNRRGGEPRARFPRSLGLQHVRIRHREGHNKQR